MRHPLLALCASLPFACTGDGRAARPNIVLITLDTTRADHLGCYGYELPTSPALDHLAAQSVVYDHCYAVSSWTLPTHATLFTGKFPASHGARYDPAGKIHLGQAVGKFEHYKANPIADDEVTLAQRLKRVGYATGGVAAGPWMKRPFRLDRGFDFYDDDNVHEVRGRSGEDVTRVAQQFIDAHADEPFFLFLNYYDAHAPYEPRSQFVPELLPAGVTLRGASESTLKRIAYDTELRFMDAAIGELLEHLRARGLYEDTWIIVTADHGELLGDTILDGGELWGHSKSLSEAELRIPLLLKYPASDGRRGREARRVQQTDLLPTILERLGLANPPGNQGTPLDRDEGRAPTFAEISPLDFRPRGEAPRDWRQEGAWRVLIGERFKFGWSGRGTHFLVDLVADPGERRDVSAEHPELVETLIEAVARLHSSFPPPGTLAGETIQLDAKTSLTLDHTGYF